MQTTGKKISLYFHIPFCKKKCPYCHFYSIYHTQENENSYVEAIKKHFEIYKKDIQERKVVSIYFGGGTPTLLSINSIKNILSLIDIQKDCEITIEVNPEDVTDEKITAYKDLKINRVSIGVQSFDDKLLKILNRRHTSKKAKEVIEKFYKSGIKNISIDLMYDIMNQTTSSWKKTLQEIKNIPIKHISLYNLTFEENTPFYKEKDKLQKLQPNEEKSLKLLNDAVLAFDKLNFKRYEISAFAKKGYESIHNSGYWSGREFLGFGPSAFSYFNKKRFQNVCSLKDYISLLNNDKSPISFQEELKYPDNVNELLAINLRLLKGINIKNFEKEFGKIPKSTLEILKKSPFVTFEKNKVKLNEKGLLFYDTLASEII